MQKEITGNQEKEWEVDPQIKENYEELEELLGRTRLRTVLMKNGSFWQNTHDSLLFVEKIRALDSAQKVLITDLIIRPFLNQETNFLELNKFLGYFNADIYIAKHEGQVIPFRNFAEFKREALMQKNNIEIPEDASDEFSEAIQGLIQAPGVDVDFLRQMIDEYKNKKDSSTFANRLINIVEGKDKIDERQTIAPFETEIPFDPLHTLVNRAIGIHSLNHQTTKLQQPIKNDQGLKNILDTLKQADTRIKEELVSMRDRKTQDDPDKKDKYNAEYKKSLGQSTLLEIGLRSSISGVKLDNQESFALHLGEEERKSIKESLNLALENPKIKEITANTLLTFHSKQETIFQSFDLLPFEGVLEKANNVFANFKQDIETTAKEKIEQAELSSSQPLEQKEINKLKRQSQQEWITNLPSEKILEQFSDNELELSNLLLYLGLNNRKRQSESKNFKKQLDPVLKQKKYLDQHTKLKEKGLINARQDILSAYLEGHINIEEQDQESIKEILEKHGYKDIGRKLKVEILSKSDPKGWTCGDSTDCCMPLTSKKNQEYVTREDLAYFVVSIATPDGDEDLVAQSVLVDTEKKKGVQYELEEISIDNIEIANRAIKYRPMIAEAYKKLKEELVQRHESNPENKDKRFKIVIGTSYNDDGGLVTGDCTLEKTDAKPKLGKMNYSDWEQHGSNYVYYDSEAKEEGEKYFGLQIDMLDKSHVRYFVEDKKELNKIKTLLEKIGKGEDDGEGGLFFPDNYSCVIGTEDNIKGYIIAADYIQEENQDDYLIFETMRFNPNLNKKEQQEVLKQYLVFRQPDKNDNLDGVLFKKSFIEQNAFAKEVIEEYFNKGKINVNPEGDLVVKLEK